MLSHSSVSCIFQSLSIINPEFHQFMKEKEKREIQVESVKEKRVKNVWHQERGKAKEEAKGGDAEGVDQFVAGN